LVTLVARLSSTKQIHQAIDSFKLVIDEVPNAKLEIFGAGKMRTSLEKQIKDLNLTNHVFLKGFTNDTNRIYQKSIVSRSEERRVGKERRIRRRKETAHK